MATIEIPAGFDQMFCFAVVHELENDAEWIHEGAKELKERARQSFDIYGKKKAGRLDATDLGTIREPGTYMPKAVAIAEQAFAGVEKIEGDPDVLAHICEGLVRWVVPAVIEQTPGPLDCPQARVEILPIGEAFTWAAMEALRLYAECHDDEAESKAAVA